VRSKWSSGQLVFQAAQVGAAAQIELSGVNLLFSGAPTTHPINFTGMTLPASSNLIRGTEIAPTRASGWTSFTGTVTATPAAVYSDYRELHTAGVAEVLGFGSFPYMDSGASCASMFAGQFIAFASSGSTVLTAGAVEGVGVFPLYAKAVIDSATVNSGAVIAALWASVQANVTDISGRRSDIIHMEVASGRIASVFYLKATGGAGATNLFEFADNIGEPARSTGTVGGAQAGYIKIKIASTTHYLQLYPDLS
jgi:hypothetical protein